MNVPEHLALLDARLDRLSVGRRLIASLGFEPEAVELAIYRPGAGYTPERPALPFQLEIAPWSKDDDAGGAAPSTLLRARAVVSNAHNALLPMPSTSFALTLALPPPAAEELYYRDAVADAQQAASDAPPAWLALEPASPPHPAVRTEIARIFTSPGAAPVAGQASMTCAARVLGHRLTRRNDRYAAERACRQRSTS